MNTRVNRILSAALVLTLLLTACGGGASASSMRLRKTEGTVRVSDGKGDELEIQEDLRLYSGYDLRTRNESYAWVDLDEVKLAKLDQDSRAEIEQDGKNLTIYVREGSLFFHVTEPLADDETMTIRVSTMAVGIRGTCGWVEALEDGEAMRVYLLEGKVRCEADGVGEMVQAGETAYLTEDGEIEITEFTREDIPAYVMNEVEDEDALLEDIPDGGGPDDEPDFGAPDTPPDGGGEAPEEPGFIPWSEAGLPDHVMTWHDRGLAQGMPIALNITDRDIMLSDVWEKKYLDLNGMSIDPAGNYFYIHDLSDLWELRNLTSLDLSGHDITDLHGLSGMINLTRLDLSSNYHLTDVSPLSGLSNLEYLSLHSTQVTDYTPVEFVPLLIRADGSTAPVTPPPADVPVGGGAAVPAPSAAFVSWADAGLQDHAMTWNDPVLSTRMGIAAGKKGALMLSDVWEITELSFSGDRGGYIKNISALAELKNLTKLNLWGNEITDITPLRELTNLTSLDIGFNKIRDFTPLSGLTNLTNLKLAGTDIYDLTSLMSLTNLTELNLAYNKIADLMPLSTLRNLNKLMLNDNQITDVSPLAGMTGLNTLDLRENRVTDFSPVEFVPNLMHD